MEYLAKLLQFLKLDRLYGKKLVTFTYYLALVMIAGNLFYNFVAGIAMLFLGTAGGVFGGLWRMLAAPFVAAFLAFLARLLAEFFLSVSGGKPE